MITNQVPESDIIEFQAQFDKVIDEGEGVVEVIQLQRVNINGVQGFHYLYTFSDDRSGQQGIHSHFFLPAGERLYALVFQALPAANYERLARTFDQIITSFKLIQSEESPSPAAPSP